MDWTAAIDGYCERTDAAFWSEPANAITNAAFLLAALIMWRRCRGANLPIATALCVILFVIGVGSFLFHTYAQPWAALIDVLPIVAFSLLYVFAANRDYWRLSPMPALLLTAGYFPYSAVVGWVAIQLPFFEISAFYWPLPLLIAVYGWFLRRRDVVLARGLWIGAGLLSLSLTFRSVDEIVCPGLPLGTHFVWHILNAVMLGWMIEVYRRHMVAGARAAV